MFIIDKGLHITDCERLVVTVSLIDAVEATTHGLVSALADTSAEHQQQDDDIGQSLHSSDTHFHCKGTIFFEIYSFWPQM